MPKSMKTPRFMRDIKDKFLRYYSVNMGNYEVTRHFLTNPMAIEVEQQEGEGEWKRLH